MLKAVLALLIAARSGVTAPLEEPLGVTLEIKKVPLTPSLEINSSPDAPPGFVLQKFTDSMNLVRVGAGVAGPEAMTRYTYREGYAIVPYNNGLSPDGRWFAFPVIQSSGNTMEGDYYSTHRIGLHDRQTDKLRYGPPEIASGDYGNWQWSPDGRFLAYVASGLWVYNVTRNRSLPLLRGYDPSHFAFTSNRWVTPETPMQSSATVQRRTRMGGSATKWSVLYSLRNKPPRQSTTTKESDELKRPIVPSIYEAPLPGSRLLPGERRLQANLVLEGGFAPVPSPDGRFIAYFGSSQEPPAPLNAAGDAQAAGTTSKKSSEELGLYSREARDNPLLCIYDRREKKRVLVEPVLGRPTRRGEIPPVPQVSWLGDGKSFVVLDYRYDYQQTTATAQIYTVEAANGKARLLTTHIVKDGQADQWYREKFNLLPVSHDGRHIFLLEKQLPATKPGETSVAINNALYAIDLHDGAAIYLAKTSASTLEWFDESKEADVVHQKD